MSDKMTGSGINCFISSLIIRNDSDQLNQKVQLVNTLLSKLVSDKVHLSFNISTGEGSTSAEERVSPLPIILSKLLGI